MVVAQLKDKGYVTVKVVIPPLRKTSSLTEVFGAIVPILRANSRAFLTFVPLRTGITSPDLMPALAAGLPEVVRRPS